MQTRTPRWSLLRTLWQLFLMTLSVFMLLFGLVATLVIVQSQRDDSRPADAAVVLGAAQWNGTPSPVLRARLDRAAQLLRQNIVKRIVLTGGVGDGDTVSEAAASRTYLLQQGIAPDALLLEEKGRSTLESMQYVEDMMESNQIGSVLLVSDGFHMLRSLKMAHDLGIDAYASPVRTPLAGQQRDEMVRYVVREVWAYLVYIAGRIA